MANPQYARLTPNTVATLDFTSDVDTYGGIFRVANDATNASPIYFRGDGVAPTIEGAGCEVLPVGFLSHRAIEAVITGYDVSRGTFVNKSCVIKFISAGAGLVQVQLLRA